MSTLWWNLFGNGAPVEIEIGPERGTFLLATAAAQPQRNYLGIERSPVRARLLERSLRQAPLPNVRILCGDAACVIATCVSPASVAAYHIYFPDPWWKRRHRGRRLVTASFAASVADTLQPGGAIYLVTDVEELFNFSVRNLRHASSLRETESLPRRPVRSAFEKKALQRGSRLYSAAFLKQVSAAVGIGTAQAPG